MSNEPLKGKVIKDVTLVFPSGSSHNQDVFPKEDVKSAVEWLLMKIEEMGDDERTSVSEAKGLYFAMDVVKEAFQDLYSKEKE